MQELTSAEFKTAIAKGKVVIDFWAPWCGPCRMMAPIFEETAKGHTELAFAKVNVDEEPTIAQQCGIRGIPTLIFFEDGKEVNRFVGAANKQALESKIKESFT